MMSQCKTIPDYYQYYEQKNRNGLKYDIAIDNAIISQLSHDETITSRKLKQITEDSINRTLSPDTFYTHINVLESCKILNKTDIGRGKKVLYSLTENAKKLLHLNLLGVDWEKISLFTRIYEKFFLYDVFYEPLLTLRNEQEFDTLLSDLEVSRENLKWGTISTAEYGESTHLVYKEENYASPSVKTLNKKYVKKFWQKIKGQRSVYDKLVFFCFPKGPYNTDIMVHRNEYWQINKNSPSIKQRTEYTVTIPGVSINELVNGKTPFLDSKFDYSDVEKALDLLRQTGLIQPAFRFQGKMRYKVMDDEEYLRANLDLRNLLSILKAFYDEESGLLLYKWKHFERPTNEERKRRTWLFGEKETNKFFNEVELIRWENRKKMKQCQNVVEYHKFLNSICPEESVSKFYGPWPSSNIFYDFKQKREEEKIQQEKRKQERRKKRGERWTRTKKIRLTKKDLREDIEKYEQYLNEKLGTQLEHLPINLENEGIEDFKIMFSRTLQKYPFLYRIMRYVCPRIFEFELTKEEIEMGTVYNEIERSKANGPHKVCDLS